MQRISNIDKWMLVPSDKSVYFAGDRRRKVTLDVNAPTETGLYVVSKGEPRFLALVKGRDTVEFYVDGPFGLISSSECYVYTVDGQGVTFEAVDASSFAVVREKRERNYELEVIAARMAENMNRRLEQQADELARAFERRTVALAALAQQPAGASTAGGDQEPAGGADDNAAAGKPASPRKRGAAPAGGASDPGPAE